MTTATFPSTDLATKRLQILNFSPYTFINVHAYPESIVCEALYRKGHQITQIRCNGIYKKNCIAMSAVGVQYDSADEEKAKVCAECKKSRSALNTIFKFEEIFVDDYITASEILAINLIVEHVTADNWTDLICENVPIGRYASYEFLLNRKISSINLDEAMLPEYKAALWNALVTLHAAKKIIRQFTPHRVIAYNNLYSCNHIFCAIGTSYKATVFSLHAGNHHRYRLSQMTIFKDYRNQFLTNRTSDWQEYKQQPLNKGQIKVAYEHLNELLEAKSPWVYSIKSEKASASWLKRRLGVQENKTVLLALLASEDERYAATLVDALPAYDPPFFASQSHWIDYLLNLAKSRPEICLIIRLHPRGFSNKREGVLSMAAISLLNQLKDLPHNVVINSPADNVSLHDLVKIVDVALNATSTAGLEFLMFGTPVVIYDPQQLFSYPIEFNFVARNESEYLMQIDSAISSGFSFEHVINVFKWLSYQSDIVAIDISLNYKTKHTLFRRILNRLMRAMPRISLRDLSFNRVATHFNIQNQEKLVYAIENNATSHIGAFNDGPSSRKSSAEADERAYIKRAATKYFKKIGLSSDRFR